MDLETHELATYLKEEIDAYSKIIRLLARADKAKLSVKVTTFWKFLVGLNWRERKGDALSIPSTHLHPMIEFYQQKLDEAKRQLEDL